METRRDRGLQILRRGKGITQIDDYTFKVESQSVRGLFYRVEENSQGFECECPDHQSRGSACKHIHAVRQAVQIAVKDDKATAATTTTTATRRLKLVRCMFCKSRVVVPKDVWTPAASGGGGRGPGRGGGKKNTKRRRMFRCGDCKRLFVRAGSGDGKKGRLPADTIAFDAVYMYGMGMSIRDIEAHYEGSKAKVDYLLLSRWAAEFPGGAPWGNDDYNYNYDDDAADDDDDDGDDGDSDNLYGRTNFYGGPSMHGMPAYQALTIRDSAENRRMFGHMDGGALPLAASSASYVWRKRHRSYMMLDVYGMESRIRKRTQNRGSGRWWVWTGKYQRKAFRMSDSRTKKAVRSAVTGDDG